MIAARKKMKQTLTWAFYDTDNVLYYRQNDQYVPIKRQQTIHTTAVTFFSDKQPANFVKIPFQFFEY